MVSVCVFVCCEGVLSNKLYFFGGSGLVESSVFLDIFSSLYFWGSWFEFLGSSVEIYVGVDVVSVVDVINDFGFDILMFLMVIVIIVFVFSVFKVSLVLIKILFWGLVGLLFFVMYYWCFCVILLFFFGSFLVFFLLVLCLINLVLLEIL